MNDIDSRLRSQASQTPRRPLTKDFTDLVMERSLTGSALTRFVSRVSDMKGIFTMKLHLKRTILLLGVGGVLLLGGGAYGITSWASHDDSAAYGGVTTVKNGDTRFWISAKGCVIKQYYEIKKGAAITPAQISDMVAGTCETTDPDALFPGISIDDTPMATVPGSATSLGAPTEVRIRYYTTAGTVKTNDGKTMTIVFSLKTGYATETFPVVASAKAFEDGKPISLSGVKAGNSVMLVMQVQATANAIQNLSLDWQDAGHDTLPGSSIYGVEKMHHADYDVYAEGTEFTPLVPNPKDTQGMSYKKSSAFDENPANLHEEYSL